jgi:hypothetical protein
VPVGIEIEVELAARLIDDDAAAVETDAAESPVYS